MEGEPTQPPTAADRTLLIGGIGLLSVGSVLALLGALLSGIVAVRATRRWVDRWQEPPSAMARRRLNRTRSAVAAGARGWREDGRPAVPVSAGSTT
jgi:hypothetical protein